MNKFIYIIIGIVVFFGIVALVTAKFRQTLPPVSIENNQNAGEAVEGAENVAPGSYVISESSSESSKQSINWSGKKPLILGYVDSGTIPLKSAEIEVGENGNLSGSFVFDVENLQVGLTAKKPGQEGGLAKHLKSDAFFNVEEYPEATFALKSANPVSGGANGAPANTAADFSYNFVGDLKIKDIAQEISFPGQIYMKDGDLHIHANTQIDRTKWGMTFASGNFFQNLGDGLVDDMVTISFGLMMSVGEMEEMEAETGGVSDMI